MATNVTCYLKAEWVPVLETIGTAGDEKEKRHCFVCEEGLRTFFSVTRHVELVSVLGFARAGMGLYLCEDCNEERVLDFNRNTT